MSESTSIPIVQVPAAASSAAEALSHSWQQGQQPDVHAFLARAGALRPHQLAAGLLVDQRQRWQRGERVGTQVYLEAYPSLREVTEAVLDLIYNEYLLGCEGGDMSALSDFGQRYPEYAGPLRLQIELRQAVGAA